MKLKKFISAAAAALMLLSASAFNVSAEKYSLYAPDALTGSRVSADKFRYDPNVKATTVEEAAAHIRECMRERDVEFSITIQNSGFADSDDAALKMLSRAMEETSDGRAGDYIRFALKSYRYAPVELNGKLTLFYEITYYSSREEEQAADKKIAEMMDSLMLRGRSEYETIKAVYDCIASNVTYARNVDESDLSIFTSYGAVVKGEAVCQGYSVLLYRMLKDAGISCRIISGTSRGIRHTWNIARADGKYYLLDVTWDSLLGGSEGGFFMRGTSDFDEYSPESKHIAVYEYEGLFSDYNSESFKAEYPISDVKMKAPVYSLGDVDGNSIVDGRDATAVLTAYAVASVKGIYPMSEAQLYAADVTGNGVTDGIDASFILSYYAACSAGKADDITVYISNRI